jgi:hypothetical protein
MRDLALRVKMKGEIYVAGPRGWPMPNMRVMNPRPAGPIFPPISTETQDVGFLQETLSGSGSVERGSLLQSKDLA